VVDPDIVEDGEDDDEYVIGLTEPLSVEEELGKADDEYVIGLTEPLMV